MEESQKIKEDQQQRGILPDVKPIDSQQEIIQKEDNVDQPSSHDDPLVPKKIIQERDDYSEQPSFRDSSEEDSNQTISEEGKKHQEIKSNRMAQDEDNEDKLKLQEQIVQKDEKDQRVSSHSAQWSSEKEMEGYEEQILQMVKQRQESEGHHQPADTRDNIKQDQGQFVSLMNRYNELQKKMDQFDRQRSESLCSGCGLLKSNLVRKIVNGAALQIYFCTQCDSKYQIIPK